MSNNVVEILKGVVSELREIARSETIIGEPVQVGKRTVIPVVRISVGFGVGGGQGEEQKGRSGFGGGGGGGVKIDPAAFIILDDKDISLLPVAKGKIDQIIDAIPNFAQKLSKLKEKLKKDKTEDSGGVEQPPEEPTSESEAKES
jgi:uncharacterized spore protein YtfJ